MKNKIGIGLITYNSPERCQKSSYLIPSGIGDYVIVNDGTPYANNSYPTYAEVITHRTNLSVGCAKNTALRHLVKSGCEHIFLIEDDILVNDSTVFQKYIETANESGLYHLIFGYNGVVNVDLNGHPAPKTIIEYKNAVQVALNRNCTRGFCYYHVGVIKNVGYMDEVFKNFWEQHDYSYRVVKSGLLPAYGWWPDLVNSYNYLGEIPPTECSSVSRTSPDCMKDMQTGGEYFNHIHGYYPTTVPNITLDDVTKQLKTIQKAYARPIKKEI